jgi:dTDP-4-amino-4,6-dideoxygalactose transaminase
VAQFEAAMATYLGVPETAAVNCGTSALWLALKQLNLQAGDEVIVPTLTFAANVHAVHHAGGTPVFADVATEHMGLTPQLVLPHITHRTKAILAVHLYGFACDVQGLATLAQAHGLTLIEDAAEALGTTIATPQGPAMVGTLGDWGAFSFNGNKTMTTGSGGLVVAKQPQQVTHIRQFSTQFRRAEVEVTHDGLGFNARMNALQASLGLAQLGQLPTFLAQKQAIASTYQQGLQAMGRGDTLWPTPTSVPQQPSHWLTCIKLAHYKERQAVLQAMGAASIECRPLFKPLHLQTPYQPFFTGRQKHFPNAEALWEQGLCLPSSTSLTPTEQERVLAVLASVLNAGG